jgi:arabinofuranosyltransferase
VEGYTNFLWLLLLEFVWRTLGVEPPDSANILSLGFAMGTLVFGALIGLRMKLTGAGVKLRYPLVFIALFAAVTNRTFLAWSSSGLETALFTFLLTAWIFFMLNPTRNLSAWVFLTSLLATLTYLTRPDGLLVVFGTLFLLLWKRVRAELTNTDVSFALPLLIVPAHFLWRKSYYGLWFPNTFYAKYVAAWPESGMLRGPKAASGMSCPSALSTPCGSGCSLPGYSCGRPLGACRPAGPCFACPTLP